MDRRCIIPQRITLAFWQITSQIKLTLCGKLSGRRLISPGVTFHPECIGRKRQKQVSHLDSYRNNLWSMTEAQRLFTCPHSPHLCHVTLLPEILFRIEHSSASFQQSRLHHADNMHVKLSSRHISSGQLSAPHETFWLVSSQSTSGRQAGRSSETNRR